MKKVLVVFLLAMLSMSTFAQRGEMSGHANIGYQSDYKRFGVGFQGRYGITNEIRVAPELTIFFPKNKTWGLDINLNAHYVFDVAPGISVYPLAGLNISNNRTSGQTIKGGSIGGITIPDTKIDGFGFTNFGFNLGGGVDYDLSPTNYLNFEMKYTFADWDYGQFMFGYGFRF